MKPLLRRREDTFQTFMHPRDEQISKKIIIKRRKKKTIIYLIVKKKNDFFFWFLSCLCSKDEIVLPPLRSNCSAVRVVLNKCVVCTYMYQKRLVIIVCGSKYKRTRWATRDRWIYHPEALLSLGWTCIGALIIEGEQGTPRATRCDCVKFSKYSKFTTFLHFPIHKSFFSPFIIIIVKVILLLFLHIYCKILYFQFWWLCHIKKKKKTLDTATYEVWVYWLRFQQRVFDFFFPFLLLIIK